MRHFYFCLGIVMFLFFNNSYSQSCSTLEILTTTPGSVCGGGSVTLSVTTSGTGDEVVWYNAATGGDIIGVGTTFETPVISATTSYWATEIIGVFTAGSVGPVDNTFGAGSGTSAAITTYYMEFDVLVATELVSVDIFPVAAVGSSSSIEIRDSSGATIINVPYTTTVTGGATAQTIPINVSLPIGNGYRMGQVGPISLFRNTAGAVYPYTSPYINIVSNNFGPTYYYYFYNWQYGEIDVICESPRMEVIATVNNDADEDILALPYTHTANTATYFNNYSGAPGADCGSSDSYLDGNDVVYKYVADDDYILTVELSGLSEPYSGVFIYESCSDIGTACYAEGSVNETTGTHSFQVAVEDGEEYFIVVSSADPTVSMNYTLTVNGTTCANFPAPVGPATQNFVDGQTLADLDVTGSDLTWYSDVALTTDIPDDTVLVNATTYYVTQSFQGCESSALAVTVNEVPCSSLSILNTTAGAVCGEGSVILEAQGTGSAVNTDIYWFDAATGGNQVGKGSSFRTPELEQTTSFWAAEVAITGETFPGQAETNPPALINTTTSNAGLLFEVTEAFNLESVTVLNTAAAGGQIQVDIRDVNDNNNIVFTTIAAMPGGGTITAPVPVVIPINHNLPVGNYRILRVTSGTTVGLGYMSAANSSFPYVLANNVGTITTGSLLSSTSTLYYYFFDWTIGAQDILCESSPRVEVVATVNDVADEMVAEPLPYVHTANTSTYGNNYEGAPGSDCNASGGDFLNGADVVYQYSPSVGGVYSIQLSGLSSNNAAVFVYESCYDIGSGCYAGAVSDGTTNDFGIAEVPMYDGFDYFIVVSTSSSPSTDYTLTIDLATINCADYTAAPGGDEDQFFEPGDTLADLVVIGGNLQWYSDSAGTNPLPTSTLLVDGTTYYVNQTLNGCVSNMLAVTVTEIDCTNLEILSTTDGTIVCKGTVVLEAVGNGGPGTEIFWYNDPVAGDRVGIGSTFTTPELTVTTSYWATEVFILGQTPMSGQAKPAPVATENTTLSNYGLAFEVTQPFTLVSVDVYPNTAGGPVTVELRLNDGVTVLETLTVNVPPGNLTTPHTIPLNFDITTPGTYRLMKEGATSLVREFAAAGGNVFPYPLGNMGQVTGGVFGTGAPNTTYYFFYNWTIGSGQVLCESPRVEVIATVTQDGDIVVPPALPYIDANNNTSNYGNTFSGTPGTACGTTENYLNGNDVVYMYTPTMDDVVDIRLKDLTGFYAGLFVYESCGNIGTDCIAGVVAGPSSNDISIEEFTVLAGETYYIVVSSWLTSSIGYTLEINGFECSAFPAPVGDANQNYAAPATLADLVVEGTMSTIVLTWYSDAAGTIVIPDTTTLVDGTTYYVSQTFGTCESPLLAITVHEIDCSNLQIVNTTNGQVVCSGSMTLTATASGSGDEIYWYDAQSGGNLIAIGSTYTTPVLTSSQSYWATEVYLEQGSGSNVLPTPCTPIHGSSGCGSGDNINDFVLSEAGGAVLINHLATGCSTNAYGNFVNDPNLTAILVANSTYDVSMTHTFSSSQWVKIWIDFNFDGTFDESSELVFQSTSGSVGGVTNGSFTIPSSVVGSTTVMRVSVRYAALPDNACNIGGTFGETHDYKVTIVGSSALCESPRVEVFATVNQTGDVVVGPLPYTDTNNTISYGNNFSGGSGCTGVTGNYLNGNDVVYQYSPANDDIITIELTGVSNNTGVFVYESCGDVGGACLAGRAGIGKIEDFYVTGGQDYFIVIGSQSGSTSYTLDIYGYDCLTDLDAPEGDSVQYFVGTKDLTDLTVDQYIHSTGLTWYSDASGTNSIPDTTPLVDGTTYWVSQTVLGCTSPLLAITALEFACTDLEIVSATGGVVCQSGSMTLTAHPGGIGNEVYWYSSSSGGNPIAVGNVYQTPILTTTTSYWAEEVYIEGSAPLSGQAKPAPTGTLSFATTALYGIVFNATQTFTLMSVDVYPSGPGGTINVELWDAGTSNVIASVTANVPAGTGTTAFTIPLNFQVPPGQNYRLIKTNPTSVNLIRDSSGNVYPYPIGTVGEVLGGVLNMGSPLAAYYWFYNWTIGDGIVLCESPRVEVIAEVNTTLPAAPVGPPAQDFCGTDNTVGNLVVTGTNIKWYNAAGNPIPTSTPLVDGASYFATQTVNACEGSALEIVVTIVEKSDKPVGDRNQPFVQGETLADLDVTGLNLQWYSDPLGNNPLPETTLLVDQTTYFVTQTLADLCESEALDIKVHRVLGVDDVAFANLVFYPNPAQDYVTISNTDVIESIEVYSLLGQKVIHQRVGDSSATIDVTGLASGPYLLNITIDGKTGIYKLIKK